MVHTDKTCHVGHHLHDLGSNTLPSMLKFMVCEGSQFHRDEHRLNTMITKENTIKLQHHSYLEFFFSFQLIIKTYQFQDQDDILQSVAYDA